MISDGNLISKNLPIAAIWERSQKGSGESAFLTTIDGIENQGDTGHNWTYSVNGKHADRSFEIYKLEPGDQVLWTFGPQK